MIPDHEVMFVVTRRDMDAIAGHPITDEEAEQFAKAIPFSSIPDALGEIAFAVCENGSGLEVDE